MVYRVSFRIVKAVTQRNPVLKNKNKQTKNGVSEIVLSERMLT